jgi:hypothetical protein
MGKDRIIRRTRSDCQLAEFESRDRLGRRYLAELPSAPASVRALMIMVACSGFNALVANASGVQK